MTNGWMSMLLLVRCFKLCGARRENVFIGTSELFIYYAVGYRRDNLYEEEISYHRNYHNCCDRIFFTTKKHYKQAGCKTLASIVNSYKWSRLTHSFLPYQESQVVVELNGFNGNTPLHILLGDINVSYESANKCGFSIRNSSALLECSEYLFET